MPGARLNGLVGEPLASPVVRLTVRAVAMAAVGCGLLLAVGCSTDVPDRAQLTEALVHSGVDAEVAKCTADAIVDSLSEDELRLIVERGPAAGPVDDPEVKGETADKLNAALEPCVAAQRESELSASTTTTTITSSTTSTVPVTTTPTSVESSTTP